MNVADNNDGTWNVELGLDSTGYFGPKSGVVQAGFKAFDGATDVDSSLAGWTEADFAGINSSGLCAGGSEPNFVCTSGYTDITTNPGVYTWNFTVGGGTLLDEWSIKFQYGDPTGVNRGHLISAPGTPGNPVPEPSAALVFAIGLLVAAPRLRRRQPQVRVSPR